MAARSPAPPAPMTRTSYSLVWYSGIYEKAEMGNGKWTMGQFPISDFPFSALEDSPIRPYTHGTQPDIQIRERHPHERHVGPVHVPAIQLAGTVVTNLASARLRDLVTEPAHDVAEGVTPKRV